MRTIKFRAFDKDTKQMWDGDFSLFEALGDNIELMQFTGLLDKNGKEIYEGDIITCEAVQREANDVIKKDEKILVEYKDGYFYPFGYNCGWRSSVGDIEVIGNIYENHELLK